MKVMYNGDQNDIFMSMETRFMVLLFLLFNKLFINLDSSSRHETPFSVSTVFSEIYILKLSLQHFTLFISNLLRALTCLHCVSLLGPCISIFKENYTLEWYFHGKLKQQDQMLRGTPYLWKQKNNLANPSQLSSQYIFKDLEIHSSVYFLFSQYSQMLPVLQ